jgi:hypothetical protein
MPRGEPGSGRGSAAGVRTTARPYEQAVQLFSPYRDIQDPNPEVRASLRELIDRAREARRAAYIYVNNRLEGNAPATIMSIVEQAER